MYSANRHQQPTDDKWVLRLYVAGESTRSKSAVQNLRTLCDEYLKGKYSLEVVDLQSEPALAEQDRIFAVPTLVRQNPTPKRKIIGDLSDTRQVLTGLGLYR